MKGKILLGVLYIYVLSANADIGNLVLSIDNETSTAFDFQFGGSYFLCPQLKILTFELLPSEKKEIPIASYQAIHCYFNITGYPRRPFDHYGIVLQGAITKQPFTIPSNGWTCVKNEFSYYCYTKDNSNNHPQYKVSINNNEIFLAN